MAENSVENNVSKPRIPGRNGGSLNPGGTPGNSGGGRPPNEFKAMMRELASSKERWAALQTILENPDNPKFMDALKHVTEHGYGKATQPVAHEGEVTVVNKGYVGIDPEKDV